MRTLFIKSSVITVMFLLLIDLRTQAQQPLDAYIEVGLTNNLVLQQKNISYEKALNSLKIANGMFSPSVSLLVNYTSGDGGRRISIPVGDLMNPVYSTLNQLTGSGNFPQIENVNQNFFPKDFYDARVRTSMPILNTDLLYNRKIKAQQTLMAEFEVDSYKRELIRSIKVAYFQYLSSLEGMKIYQSALTRAQEGKRVNESLLKNGKGLPAYILRSESEIENLNAQLGETERQAANAKMYFNFLLNRDLQEDINTDFDSNNVSLQIPVNDETSLSTQNREELKQLKTLISINQDILKMNSLFWVPRLSGFIDLGSQAEHFKYNSQSRYYLVGFQLEVPLFAGFTNHYKVNQAQLDVKQNELNQSNINYQLNLASKQSYNSLINAQQNYISSQKQLDAAQSYQRLIDKGYREGANTFIESIDARNQLTSAQLLVTLNQYKLLIALANLERETASYPLKK